MNQNSERRIRNNRIRRKRQLYRNIAACLFTVFLIISLSFAFFSFKTKAQSSDEEILYKYYKSIVVENGDTLWGYAEIYGNTEYYDSYETYIKEVMHINFLPDEQITYGQHLILPYYSPDIQLSEL